MNAPIAEIQAFNNKLSATDKEICDLLAHFIAAELTESDSKVWHAHPVWFIAGNPIVGYNKQKNGVRLMFWSGASFEEELLIHKDGKFKDASIFYNHPSEISTIDLMRWLVKARTIQWDYKNCVKRKGHLERL